MTSKVGDLVDRVCLGASHTHNCDSPWCTPCTPVVHVCTRGCMQGAAGSFQLCPRVGLSAHIGMPSWALNPSCVLQYPRQQAGDRP